MSKVTFGSEFPPVVGALQMFAHYATIGEACVAMRALIDKSGESVVDAGEHVGLAEQHHTLWRIVQQICTAQHRMPRIA